MRCIPLLLLVLSVAPACSRSAPDSDRSVTVFAGAGMTAALQEIAAEYQRQAGTGVVLNLASSGTLARQLEAGASADVFLSASARWMDYVQREGLLRPGTRRDLVGTGLVLVAPRESELAVTMTPGFDLPAAFSGPLACGEPDHVPAGRYAVEALRSLGWLEALQSRLTRTQSVASALAQVESGQVAAGVVYAGTASRSPRVQILAAFPAGSHSPIRFPVALCRNARPAAESFVSWLSADDAAHIWARHGFDVVARSEPVIPVGADRARSMTGQALGLSLRVAAVTTVVLAVPGLGLGWLLARKQFPGRSLLNAAVCVPLVVPPVATGYMLLLLLGRNGWLGRWLHRALGVEIAFTWCAAVLACAVVSLPLMVRSARAAVESVDVRYEQASRTLRAGPWRTFAFVTLPLAWRGVLAGLILTFGRSLGEFGATITFAGNIPGRTRTLPVAAYTAMQQPGGQAAAMRLVGISIVLSVIVVLASEWLLNRQAGQKGVLP